MDTDVHTVKVITVPFDTEDNRKLVGMMMEEMDDYLGVTGTVTLHPSEVPFSRQLSIFGPADKVDQLVMIWEVAGDIARSVSH